MPSNVPSSVCTRRNCQAKHALDRSVAIASTHFVICCSSGVVSTLGPRGVCHLAPGRTCFICDAITPGAREETKQNSKDTGYLYCLITGWCDDCNLNDAIIITPLKNPTSQPRRKLQCKGTETAAYYDELVCHPKKKNQTPLSPPLLPHSSRTRCPHRHHPSTTDETPPIECSHPATSRRPSSRRLLIFPLSSMQIREIDRVRIPPVGNATLPLCCCSCSCCCCCCSLLVVSHRQRVSDP